MLISQLESLNVIRAPLPGTLPVKSSIIFNSLLPRLVTVKLSQFVSCTSPKNGSGFPSPGFFIVTLLQSSPEIGFNSGSGAGVWRSPKVALSVIHALVIIQISPAWISTVFSSPLSSRCSVFAVIPSPSAKSISVTVQFSIKLTPLSLKYVSSGLITLSYWFNGVLVTPSSVSILENSRIIRRI